MRLSQCVFLLLPITIVTVTGYRKGILPFSRKLFAQLVRICIAVFSAFTASDCPRG